MALIGPYESEGAASEACAITWDCLYGECVEVAGSGGTYTSLVDCQAECDVTWDCLYGTCAAVEGVGGLYESLIACEAACGTTWECVDAECMAVIGQSGTYATLEECEAACVYTWNCESGTACVSVLGTGGTFTSQASCTSSCGSSWNCITNECLEVDDLSGAYPTEIACVKDGCGDYTWNCSGGDCVPVLGPGGTYTSEADCVLACYTSYNCADGVCVSVSGTGGAFASLIACEAECVYTWNCSAGSCVSVLGTGGTYTSQAACEAACGTSWDCVYDECVEVGGLGGAYPSLLHCARKCGEYTWNCDSGDCTPVLGSGGTYTSESDCLLSCVYSWNCEYGDCVSVSGTGGTYTSLSACTAECTGSLWECVYGECMQTAEGTYETEAACTAECNGCVGECTYECIKTEWVQVSGSCDSPCFCPPQADICTNGSFRTTLCSPLSTAMTSRVQPPKSAIAPAPKRIMNPPRVAPPRPVEKRVAAPTKKANECGCAKKKAALLTAAAEKVAVLACLFNPAGYTLPVVNYGRFADGVRKAGLTLFAAEVAYGDAPFATDAGLKVRAGDRHVLWQRERLLNMLERTLPDQYEYVAWVDADVLFPDNSWGARAVDGLKKFRYAQLWKTAKMLDREGATQETATSAAAGGVHTGLGWAARRGEFPLYDRGPLGGDVLLAAALGLREPFAHFGGAWRADWARWAEGRKTPVGHAPLEVSHLWHGDRNDRHPLAPRLALFDNGYDPNTDLETCPDTGLLRWTDAAVRDKPRMVAAVADYFKQRREDG